MTGDINREYYSKSFKGLSDYWQKMAAPHYRTSKIVGHLKKFPIHNVVDLGCGEGCLLAEINKNFPDAGLFGLDLSNANIKQASFFLPKARFIEMDLGKEQVFVPELLEKFDVVTASEIIEHVGDPLALLSNARRLAQKNGVLILTTQSGRIFETERRVGHVRHFSAAEITEMLQRTGWQPVTVSNCGFPFHDLSKWFANINPDLSMRLFGDRPYSFFQNMVCYILKMAFKLNSNTKGKQLWAVANAV